MDSLKGTIRNAMQELRQVVVYSRKLERRGGFTWQEVDVESDNTLRRQFTDEVPVVFIDGRKAFKYHMSETDFLRKLAS